MSTVLFAGLVGLEMLIELARLTGGCVPGYLAVVNYCFVGFYTLEALVTQRTRHAHGAHCGICSQFFDVMSFQQKHTKTH